MNKILITGATGFLGSKILKKLVEDDYNVVALVRKTSNLNRIESVKGDFDLFYFNEKSNNLNELFENYKIETIIHTATEYGRNAKTSEVLKTNVIFPIQLIEFGLERDLKLFINSDTFFGKPEYSNSAYLNQYTNSKKYFLDYLFCKREGFKAVNLRLEHIFGEFDSDNKFVTDVLHKMLKSEKEVLLTDGLQKRDFVYVEDVVNAYLKVLRNIDSIANISEFEVGRGESVSVRQFVELMAEQTKSKSKLFFGGISTRKGEIQNSVANILPLNDLGWKPIYDLKTAIRKMIELELR
ncbi:NAD-dependent epimerase/dehydratase family protein [Flavobacterium sp.]|jgi:nucleoside-diphosphate-sugar epimerase|uniref:NAD-dependent epimerase/dehydratase family protein n=1 Tax=Flavobacterium sp. TaxID=239 RepID=UPI0022BD955D|nr:NAD-dependent epimerase/dehydratase family protein [Flavobacterium sp.]MCZ8230047.1 NAD-dependent epimerase/dehydratase family protein [Flavobacterium sp.]